MLNNFEKYLTSEKRTSEHTLKAYLKDVSDFLNFTEVDSFKSLSEIHYQIVRAWMVHEIEKGISNRSVNRKLSSLRTFYKWTMKEGLVQRNPMLKIQGPKIEKRLPEFVKKEELALSPKKQLNDQSFDELTLLIVELFYQTGIRLSELIELKKNDLVNMSIKVIGKRNKERIIPISEALFHQLTEYSTLNKSYNSTNNLFCTIKGNKLYPKLVYRKINNYLTSVTNLRKRSPHVLRHTFATHMLNNGAGLETLKELLGHSNLTATQVYTHNSFEEINKIYKQAHPRGGHKKR